MQAYLKGGLLILLLFPLSLCAQELIVKGKVVNAQSEPLEFASIKLAQRTPDLIYSISTDRFGVFFLKVMPGQYEFTVSTLGKPLFKQALSVQTSMDLGTITVQNTHQLDSVTIIGKKNLFERKVDRLIFNVENSVVSQGSDGLDILRVTPNIRVEEDNISMVGKSTMAVMVNNQLISLSGRDLASYIKSFRSEEIHSIEVITSPPAQFDAAGNSGIVRIVLKKRKKNTWNGNVTTSLRKSKVTEYTESASFNYSKGKIGGYWGFSNANGVDYYRTEESNIIYADKIVSSLSTMKEKNDINVRGRAGMDYEISKRLSAGIFYSGIRSEIPGREQNETKVAGLQNYLLQTAATYPQNTRNSSYNLHAAFQLDSAGSNISFNADLFEFHKANDRTFHTRQYNDFVDHMENLMWMPVTEAFSG